MSYEVEIIECEQGGEEWQEFRSGAITASAFKIARDLVGGLTDKQQIYVDAILAGKSKDDAKKAAKYTKEPTGEKIEMALDGIDPADYSETAKSYAFRLAIERITGEAWAGDRFLTPEMRRGRELEPRARARHQLEIDATVERAGIAITDDGRFAASPDGLIGDDGGAEYKCLSSPVSLRPVVLESDYSEYIDQVHGGMWLCGRDWWDLAFYTPQLEALGLDFICRRFYRDDDYIAELVRDLERFDAYVNGYVEDLRKMGKQIDAGGAP